MAFKQLKHIYLKSSSDVVVLSTVAWFYRSGHHIANLTINEISQPKNSSFKKFFKKAVDPYGSVDVGWLIFRFKAKKNEKEELLDDAELVISIDHSIRPPERRGIQVTKLERELKAFLEKGYNISGSFVSPLEETEIPIEVKLRKRG